MKTQKALAVLKADWSGYCSDRMSSGIHSATAKHSAARALNPDF
jgi:hypothetical protein